ncbi:MAG: guanylate kinase [Actinobacteria bacterium]|nr:MAG: guanylate kinase [Actinomycetota bacterium]
MAGRLFVVAGPSGVGKGTVVRLVRERIPATHLSISVTTRAPRPGERDGVDYRFVSDEDFERMIASGELLEWEEIFGHRSGTPAEPVREALEAGVDVLLELDVTGARHVREVMPQAVLILLEPPTLEELERRLRSRGTETEERLAARLSKADWELGQRDAFDEVIVNDEAERAADQVAAIIDASPQVGGSSEDTDAADKPAKDTAKETAKETEGPSNP